MLARRSSGWSLTWLFLRGFADPSLKPRTHRRAIQHLDRDGDGRILRPLTLSKVCSRCLITLRPCLNARIRCQRSMFVARDEHEEVNIIACPLPDCNHAWCKQCQQSIDFSGPKHSCDGTSELDHLMKEQGWKYCPCMFTSARHYLWSQIFFSACKTPVQKESGCNHMTVR